MRVGVDLVDVEVIEDAIDQHGQEYLRRIYTDGELLDCTTNGVLDAQRLAARFAAKEAAIKVLRPSAEDPLPLRCIEVTRDQAGWVALQLSGPAAELASRAKIADIQLSITHENLHACAVVIAELG